MAYVVALEYKAGLWSWSLFDDLGELVHSSDGTYDTPETALALARIYLTKEEMSL